MRLRLIFALIAVLLTAHEAWSQTFVPTSGPADWNNDANWSAPPFPNLSGTAAILPAPTGALTVNLNQPITVGSLLVNKQTATGFDTTIQGSAINTLTFDGANTLTNAASTDSGASATGVTILEAPLVLTSGLTITQNDNDGLRLMQPISGTGNVNYNRGTGGSGVVAVTGANTYSGSTVLTGSGGQDYMLVRLNSATAIPGGIGATGGTSNITLTASAVIGLRADDFKRTFGAGPDQIQFVSASQSGWAAFIENRAVNIGGASATIAWGTSGGNFGTLVLGHDTADKTLDFQNPIRFTTSTGTVSRSIRVPDGSAAIDARITGGLIRGNASDGNGSFVKEGDGTLSLEAASTYSGTTGTLGITTINGGVLLLNHASALANGNLIIQNTGVLGLGAGDFTRSLGTGDIQFRYRQTGNGSGGWAAYNANRAVNIGGAGAQVTWGDGTFIQPTASLFLSYENSDATVDFQNPINLNGGSRTFAVRDGSAAIDGKASGTLSGVGGSIVKGQAGTLELSAANTYDGTTTIQNGVLLLTNANSIPGGIAGNNINTIVFTSNGGMIGLGNGNFTSDLGTGLGKVQFSATNNHGFAAFGTDRSVNLGGAGAQVSWGVNNFIAGQFLLGAVGADKTLDFQNPIDLNGAVRTFDVRDGSTAVDGLLSGALSGAGGGIQKNGAGTLKLTGANSYDGVTTVSAGRLLVSNASGSGTGSGSVTVNGGTLGGTGSIDGAVTVNTGGHVAPGESIESLNLGSLTLNVGSVLDFELGAPGSPGVNSDLVNVSNTDGLTLSGGSVVLTNAGGLATGTYTLIDYLGALGGDVANLGMPTGPAGFTYSLVNNVGNTSIDLSVMSAGVAGDYNGNNIVDAADYVLWRKHVGITSGATKSQGDGNGDGDVDNDDYTYWRERFGNIIGGGSALGDNSTVPEPTTFALMGILGVLCARLGVGRIRYDKSQC